MNILDDPIFQTITVGHHQLPGIWRYMLPEDFLWMHLPEERLTTCASCPKVALGEFSASCKCCTYFPEIPNFVLGLALKDPRSRSSVEELIQGGYALPEGLQIPPGRLVHTAAEYAGDRFGKSVSIRCPLIDEGQGSCTVYPYRNSTCSTFFCYADHGAEGDKYWDRLESLVAQVEIALSQWSMGQAGLDAHDYCASLDSLVERIEEATDAETGAWSESFRRQLFGEWFGRECEFFERCAEATMAQRDRLYDIACEESTVVAFEFERAIHGMIPAENRSEIEAIPDDPGEPVFIGDLWYQLQVATRRLWALPYNEGEVVLSDSFEIAENPQNDGISRLYREKPYVVRQSAQDAAGQKGLMYLTAAEAEALRLFKESKVIGERLFETKPMVSLPGAKVFLAQCMRRNILVPV